MDADYAKGLKYVLATALVSGFAIFVNKFFVAYSDPYVFTAVKNVLVAAVLVAAYVLFRDFNSVKELTKTEWVKLAGIGVVGGSIPFLLFFKGLSMTSAANGAFIHKTMFLIVAALAAVFLRERLNFKHLAAAAALLTANVVLIGFNLMSVGMGDLLVLAATVFWAAETILSKHTLKTVKPGIVAAARMGFGSIILLGFLAATGRAGALTALSAAQATAGLVSAAILFLYVATWYHGLKHVQASTATVVLLLGAPITALLSAAFLSTAVTAAQAGGFILLAACVLAYVRLRLPSPQTA